MTRRPRDGRARTRRRAARAGLRAKPTRDRRRRHRQRLRHRLLASRSPFAGITRIRCWRSAASAALSARLRPGSRR